MNHPLSSSQRGSRPLVLVSSCHRVLNQKTYESVNQKYISTLRRYAAVEPLILPNGIDRPAMGQLLSLVDGVMLTGSPSNVHPAHYQPSSAALSQTEIDARGPYDAARDATTLALIQACVETALPLLCICRGHQEFNVAMGGSLRTLDRHAPDASITDIDAQYAKAHTVTLTSQGKLATLYQQHGLEEQTFEVNSYHYQAIDRLADSLRIEATAPDGTIEAISHARHHDPAEDQKGQKGHEGQFALGVQWHPEVDAGSDAYSAALFRAFGEATHRQRLQHTANTV